VNPLSFWPLAYSASTRKLDPVASHPWLPSGRHPKLCARYRPTQSGKMKCLLFPIKNSNNVSTMKHGSLFRRLIDLDFRSPPEKALMVNVKPTPICAISAKIKIRLKGFALFLNYTKMNA
jgi:hypothetical protein